MIFISAMATYALINLFKKNLELACEIFTNTEKCKIKWLEALWKLTGLSDGAENQLNGQQISCSLTALVSHTHKQCQIPQSLYTVTIAVVRSSQ